MAYNCVVPSIITIDPVDQCGAYADILGFSETVPKRNASYPDEIVQSLEKVNRRHRGLGGSFTPTDLKRIAATTGLDIELEGAKIALPKTRRELKDLLYFLNEQRFIGLLSGNPFIANSLRPVQSLN